MLRYFYLDGCFSTGFFLTKKFWFLLPKFQVIVPPLGVPRRKRGRVGTITPVRSQRSVSTEQVLPSRPDREETPTPRNVDEEGTL